MATSVSTASEKRKKCGAMYKISTDFSCVCGIILMTILYGYLPNLPFIVKCTVVTSLLYCINCIVMGVNLYSKKLFKKISIYNSSDCAASSQTRWNNRRWTRVDHCKQLCKKNRYGDLILQQQQKPFLYATIVCFVLLMQPSLSTASPSRSADTCGLVECKAAESGDAANNLKFQYKPGGVYNYLYKVNGTIYVDGGGPSEQSGLHFSANTTIHFLTACDAILYMKDVELWQSVLPSGQDDIHKHHFTHARTSQTFKESLEQFPLRFSYTDGLIGEICPDAREAGWVLNIKRGLLSSFQNTMRRLDLEDKSYENDVNGRCKVEYRIGEATSSTLTIEKIKDMSSCGDKYGVLSSLQGTPYNFGTQSMPAVDSSGECNQIVDRNLIVEVECKEQHRLKPLSNGISGVHVTLRQHLDLFTVYAASGVNSTEEDDDELFGKKDDDDDDGFSFGLDDEDEEDGESEKPGSNQKALEQASRVEDAGSFLIIRRKPDAYISEIISTSPVQISRRESLVFHHEYHVDSTASDYNSATNALSKFCQSVKMNVDGNAGALMETLVQIMRGLNGGDMMHLSREASRLCDGDRSLFDNVLEAVGTAASVGVIKDRIFNGDAPRERISSWINSLTFIPKPDLDLMVAALPILRARDNYPNILLSYSSLAHSFCRQHSDCAQHQPVHILSRLYEKFFNLTGCVTKQRKNVDQVLMYLKGIGNFGKFDDGIHAALQTCIDTNDRNEIRVAAIEAYRRMPCSKLTASSVHVELQKVFENQEEDAEVRISAFLTVMRCPSYPTIRWLKHVMGKEQIRQVTSFVSSYMRNLQESSLPSKLELQGLVADEEFNDPYHTDFRQFSKNFEASAFYPDGNFGMGLDSNLIFSQDSYIPRSASLNLTVDLFGESVNLLEATVRLESFEHYVESIFGPNGKLSSVGNAGISKLLSSLRRTKRAVPSKRKMRTLALGYDAMRRYYNDPIMSLSLKTLGKEVAFSRMVGLDEQTDALNSLNPLQFLEKLSNTKDSNWQKSTVLFDSSYIIPTGVGLPLNLSAQASSIMRFQAESMIDTTNFRANPFQLKLKGKLIPSALLSASAGVSLSAFKSHAGMKVRAQLRTSTALEGHLEASGTKLLDVAFGVPQSKLELIEFKSEVLFLQKDDYQPVKVQSPRPKEICNTGILYKYMGLKMCTSSHFIPPKLPSSLEQVNTEDHPTLLSNLPFLVNGPSHFALSLDKSNPSLLKTRFHYQWNNNETNTDFMLRTVRTTGTTTNPKEDELGIKYLLDKQDKSFNFDVNFPGSTATVNGQLTNEKLTVKLDVLDKIKSQRYMGFSVFLDSNTLPGSTDVQETQPSSPSPEISRTYTGSGDAFYKQWQMNLVLQGSQNSTHFFANCKGSYKPSGSRPTAPSEMIILQMLSTNEEKRRHNQLLGTNTDTKVTVDFTQYPDYNMQFIWNSQVSEDGYQNDVDFRQGRKYLTESDPTNFRIQARAHHEANHKKRGVKWTFFATQPSQQTDWGVEASFDSHGKSFDSAISFRYAPGQTYGTSFSLQRKPGVMLFLDSRWNLTIPSSPPLQVVFRIDEGAPRIYDIQCKMDWFSTNYLNLDVTLTDRSRRNKVDTSVWFVLATKTIDNFKVGVDYLSEEKETKLQLKSEYENKRHAFEVGHTLTSGSKHKIYVMVNSGENVYLVMSELEFEHGVQCSLQTDLGPNFSGFHIRVKATNQNGLRQVHLAYNWDRTSGIGARDNNKQFVFEVTLDSSKQFAHRLEGIVMYPGYNYYCEGHYRYDKDDRSRVVMGRLKWKDEEHLHVNAQLVPRISAAAEQDDHEAYDVLLEVATPFELVKNVSLNAGVDLYNNRDHCIININGTWGDSHKLKGKMETNLESLEREQGISSLEDVSESSTSRIPFKFTMRANLTSTLEGLETLQMSLHHFQYNRINCKTDFDVQLSNEKEISMTSHLVVPDSFSDLLSTQMELHIKTPFAGFQNLDAQAILGRKEDKDVVALIGVYIENLQYSVTITGTPRFEEDGALGFELTTSNPKYDKIFGSFSYVIGDNSRLACQLGWPQVVISLEVGLESAGWEEFQVYLTFSSPWMPVKNFNTRAKIDIAQFAEIKLELNEDGINAKSEWVIESWTSFDIRLDGSTPFPGTRTFGGALKNSWDDPATYHTQIAGWIDDRQAGFKLEGGTSEKEEECGFAIVRQASFEIDTVVYPTIRASFNLVNMDIKYNLDLSILLKEGPINVIAELEVLDVLRFNEKILITTPYPGLFQLEINLNPAIVHDRELYNFGMHSKWRSGSKWEEGGLVVRYGDQSIYEALVAEELENAAFEACGTTEGEDDFGGGGGGGGDDDYGAANTGNNGASVPKSQLFHFYSPIKWAKVVKLEYQLVSKSPDSDVDEGAEAVYQDSHDDEDLSSVSVVDQFPVENFELVYLGTNCSISTKLQNEAKEQTLTANIDVPTWTDRLSAEFHSSLDRSEVERKLSVRAISHHPSQQEYSVTSQWNNQLPQYFSGNLEVSTPIEKLEQQSGSLTYAHNEGEGSYSADVELVSVTFQKLATNVVLQPSHFSMTLSTPIESFQEIEIRADTKENDESPDDMKDTMITYKNGEDEVEIDLVAQLQQGWPSKITGTIAATFASRDTTQRGDVTATSQKNGDHQVTGMGEMNWENGMKMLADLNFDFPVEENVLKALSVTVNTTVEGLNQWAVNIDRTSEDNNDKLEYTVTGLSPFNGFSTFSGGLLLEKKDSWLQVKALRVHGQAANGSFSGDSSWLLEKWNNFEINAKAKYNVIIGDDLRSSYEFLRQLPETNSFGISIGNRIPTLSRLTVIDSKFKIKAQEPFLKAGQSIQINYHPAEMPAFILKSSTVSLGDTADVNIDATFNDDFDYFGGTMKFKSTGSVDRVYQADCKWEKSQESVDGVAVLVWGTEALGNTSIHSTFNCSVNEALEGTLHVLIGSPVVTPKQSDSQQEEEEQQQQQAQGEPDGGILQSELERGEEGEGNSDTPPNTPTLANPLVNPMVTMDGTFNKTSARHSARVQIRQNGVDESPIVVETEAMFIDLTHLYVNVNFTSNIESFRDVGVVLGHKIEDWGIPRNKLDGNYGLRWGENDASVAFKVLTEVEEDVQLYNVSLFCVVPISTESTPKPQKVGIDVLYKTEAPQYLETAFRGEYNGVQLLRSDYKSDSMSSAGLEKENKQLELDNHFWPFGFNHTYQYEYSGGYEGSNLPTKLVHLLHLYGLQNPEQDRFEGEMEVQSNFTGERLSLLGTHPSRKVQLIADYNSEENEFQHSAKLSLNEDSSLGYQLVLSNMTEENTDHRLSLKLSYPVRVIHLDTGYKFKKNTFEWTTAVSLNASRTDDKIVSTMLLTLEPLQNADRIAGKASVTLKHPKLAHDMIAAGELAMVGLTASSSSPGRGRIEGIFSLEYTDDPAQRLILNWDAKLDLREIVYGSSPKNAYFSLPYWQLEAKTKLEHLATNLDLKALCSTQHSPHELSIITLMDFKNGIKNASQESKMAFELLKKSKEASLQMRDPQGYALLWGQLTGQYPQFVVNGNCNVTGITPPPEANISLDLAQPYFRMYAVHGKELQDGIFGEGGVVDSRNAYFDISESYDNFRFSDVNFYLRLNHSRLITSKLQWRPEIFSEIRDLCVKMYKSGTAYMGAKWDTICKSVKEDATDSMNSFWDQLKPNVLPFLEEMEQDINFRVDYEALETFLVDMYNNNELHLRDIHDYVQLAAEEITARIKKSFQRYQRDLENPAKMLEKAFAWMLEQIQTAYQQLATAWNNYLSKGGDGISASLVKLRQLFYLYLNDALEMTEQLIIQFYQHLSNFASEIYAHIAQLVERYQPLVMSYVHEIEAMVYGAVKKVLDFFYETKEAVLRSPYYQKLEKLAQDLDSVYKDISQNDLDANFKKYYELLKGFVSRKLSELGDLKLSLGKAGERLETLLKGIMETEVMKDLKGALFSTLENLQFLIQYTEMDVLVPKVILTLISKGNSIFFWTAVDTAGSFQQAKTKFYFEPKKGIVSLEQKLPMPLSAFNESPDFHELSEYRAVTRVQELFQGSNDSYWTIYNKIVLNPLNMIPPFEGHAMLVGSGNFFTFDGLIYNHTGRCVHLLTADLVDGNFSVSLQYETSSSSSSREGSQPDRKAAYNIIIASGHNTLVIDLKEDGIKDPKRGLQQTVSLPIQMANLQGYREADLLIVETPKGLTVSCNAVYQLCQIRVSGWYSRKVAGILGTMDMEPFTDLTTASGQYTRNISEVFSSWDVSDDSSDSCAQAVSSTEMEPEPATTEPSANLQYWCNRIFQFKHSSLQTCFSTVLINPFYELCLKPQAESSGDVSSSTPPTSVCKSAVSYAAQCRSRGIQVKIPSGCIKCEMNGEVMMDRDMKVISSPPAGSPAFQSTDVVFIVEAKECNRALRTKRKIDTVALALEEELENKGFINNRYAAVVFGGDGVYDKPRPVVHNSKIFTTASEIGGHIANTALGNGNNDTFQAIWYTLQSLLFRPGVSKTFILFPCSSCNPAHMKLDFSVVHYAMLEQDAKLHILMNNDFLFDSKNLAKRFFGYDATLGFTKSDGAKGRLKGDPKIRPQVFLPKRMLGYCAPLALETNGTIFSGKKLQNRRDKVVKVFTTAFSRRVVQTATPADCQTCYCLSNNEKGIGKLECFVCSYPRYKPLPDDYDDSLSQPHPNSLIPEDDDDGTDAYEEDNTGDDDEM